MKLRGLRVVRSDDGVRCTPSDRRGGVAVEFALIAFALYLILAGMLSFGRWMAIQQAAQDVARFAAREVALYPLPAETDSLDAALADSGFRAAVYDPDYLVVNLDALAVGQTLDDVFAAMPVVNRALRPLMIFSSVDTPDGLLRLLHVPGAIVSSDVLSGPTGLAAPTGYSVSIPRVTGRDPVTGVETLEFADVLEEVKGDGVPGSLPVSRGGVANLRLNVPFQSAALVGYLAGAGPDRPIEAVDPAGPFNIVGPGPDGAGPYSGTAGLGRLEALGKQVRPFRRLIAAQALFRREVVL
jgi:hypothetical protein